MIQIGDFIAGYAAIVSSIVAILQFRDHRSAKEVIGIRQSDEWSLPEGAVTLYLTNLSSRQLDMDFFGIGWGYRPWLRPWKIKMDEASSLAVFVLQESEEIRWTKPLDPVQVVYAEVDVRKDLTALKKALTRKGFGYRACLMISHSLSSSDDIRPLKDS